MSSSLIYSTIDFSALPLRALFLCPQPCHQPTVFERVAEPSFLPVAVMEKDDFPKKWPKWAPVLEKDDFPKKWPKWAPVFSVFSVWRTESSPALICVAININSLKTRLTRHSLEAVMEKTSTKKKRAYAYETRDKVLHFWRSWVLSE